MSRAALALLALPLLACFRLGFIPVPADAGADAATREVGVAHDTSAERGAMDAAPDSAALDALALDGPALDGPAPDANPKAAARSGSASSGAR